MFFFFYYPGTTFSGVVSLMVLSLIACFFLKPLPIFFFKAYGSTRIAGGRVQQILSWPGSFENFRKVRGETRSHSLRKNLI